MNNTALLKIEQEPQGELKQGFKVPEVELSRLPAKLSKRLWVSPEEFLIVTSAPMRLISIPLWFMLLCSPWPSLLIVINALS